MENQLQEKQSLNLIVKEKKLGSLITNAKEIKSFVEEKLKTYNVDNYSGDEKQAAKDKAELNNAAKKLNDERIALEREWMTPFGEFKDIVNETVSLIKTASSKLDVIVKEKEEREKAAKKNEIEQIWKEQNFELVSFEQIFNPKWLNKTCKISSVQSEIQNIVLDIKKNLKNLEEFGEDTAQLKDIYLSNLNLLETMQKGTELRANRERLKKQDEKNKLAELEKQGIEIDMSSDISEDNISSEAEHVNEKVEESFALVNIQASENVLSYLSNISKELGIRIEPSITLSATQSQMLKLKEMFYENGFSYAKVNILSLILANRG